MARTLSAPELAVLLGATAKVYGRLEVLGPDAAWHDVSALDGGAGPVDLFDGAAWGTTIDDAVWSGTFTLRREARDPGGNLLSLTPLLTSSLLNQFGTGYAPLLNLNTRVRLSTCVVDAATAAALGVGVKPAPGHAYWHRVFDGFLTDIDGVADGERVTLQAVDLGGYVVDAQLRDPAVYGAAGGVLLETVLQAMLDAAQLGGGPVTLAVPVSPGWALRTFRQDPGGLQSIADGKAMQIGWRVRYRWAATGDGFQYTLYEPERAKTTPDLTLSAGQYYPKQSLRLSLANIRNQVEVLYRANGRVQPPVVRDVPDSVAAFGPRFMRLVEDAASNIDTEAEAALMAEAAALDLALPRAEMTIPTPYLWQVEPGDLVEFLPNGRDFDTAQAFGVVGVQHELRSATGRTTLTCRGAVAGAYREWLLRSGRGARVTPAPPAPVVGTFYGEGSAFGGTRQGACWLPVQFDRPTEEIVTHVEESPDYPAPVPDIHDANTEAKRVRRLPGARASADDWATLLYLGTTLDAGKTAVTFGLGAGGVISQRTTRYALASDPSDAHDPGTLSGLAVERRPGANLLTITRGTAGSPGAPVWCVVRRNSAVVDYFPLTSEAGAASTLAPGASVTWTDDGLDAADTFDYEVAPVVFATSAAEGGRPYAASGPLRGYGVDAPVPTQPTDPPPATPPSTTPPPASAVAAPAFGTHGGVQTPYYADAIDHDGAGWVRIVWSKPAGAFGVSLEKTYDPSASVDWREVTFSTLASYDNRVADAYASGWYRLVAKSATFAYLAISPAVFYRSPTDAPVTTSGGGGGRTSYTK